MTARDLSIAGTDVNGGPAGASIVSTTQAIVRAFGPGGNGGSITINLSGDLVLDNFARINAGTVGFGNAGSIAINASGSVSLSNNSAIKSAAEALGPGISAGNAGAVSIAAGTLTLTTDSVISSDTRGVGAGNAGSVSINVAGALLIDGAAQTTSTGISSKSTFRVDAQPNVSVSVSQSNGSAGTVNIVAGTLTMANNGAISTSTGGAGRGGDITIAIEGAMSMTAGAQVSSATTGRGAGGSVAITASGALTIAGGSAQPSGIVVSSDAPGAAGSIAVSAQSVSLIAGGQIASNANCKASDCGNGGSVVIAASGDITLDSIGVAAASAIMAQSIGSGNAGSISLSGDNISLLAGSGISTDAFSASSPGGSITINALGKLLLDSKTSGNLNGLASAIGASSTGSANAGTITVSAQSVTMLVGAYIRSDARCGAATGCGNGGNVTITATGDILLDSTNAPIGGTAQLRESTAVSTQSTGSGNAGSISVSASNISLLAGSLIHSDAFGAYGMGGSVTVSASGQLILDAAIATASTHTASAIRANTRGSGDAGTVTVKAGTLSLLRDSTILATTRSSGSGGNISVAVDGLLTIDGSGASGETGILADTSATGRGGSISVSAGALALSSGAQISSATSGSGHGGTVNLSAQGALTVSGSGSGIIALASRDASGDAGSVTVSASQIAVTGGGQIASTTAGSGAGGSVSVTAGGALVIDGQGVSGTQIAASATGVQSGAGGSVTVKADSLTVDGGGQIASTAGGLGKGGDIKIVAASDILLPDAGPQITARSTGSGDAGSIGVTARNLRMRDHATISTEAATANGGNITLTVRDLVYLGGSEITTSVNGASGNGGNIVIDPRFLVLDHSSIIAQAVQGHGGNITIIADEYLPSPDSIVSASSQLGISGTIDIVGPRVDLNGSLVVLSSELRSAAEVLRNSCAARSALPRSTLTEAGRGGLPQDPEATIPALYLAGRDAEPAPPTAATAPRVLQRSSLHLTIHCGD